MNTIGFWIQIAGGLGLVLALMHKIPAKPLTGVLILSALYLPDVVEKIWVRRREAKRKREAA